MVLDINYQIYACFFNEFGNFNFFKILLQIACQVKELKRLPKN
jgi:hypothetical protein